MLYREKVSFTRHWNPLITRSYRKKKEKFFRFLLRDSLYFISLQQQLFVSISVLFPLLSLLSVLFGYQELIRAPDGRNVRRQSFRNAGPARLSERNGWSARHDRDPNRCPRHLAGFISTDKPAETQWNRSRKPAPLCWMQPKSSANPGKPHCILLDPISLSCKTTKPRKIWKQSVIPP